MSVGARGLVGLSRTAARLAGRWPRPLGRDLVSDSQARGECSSSFRRPDAGRSRSRECARTRRTSVRRLGDGSRSTNTHLALECQESGRFRPRASVRRLRGGMGGGARPTIWVMTTTPACVTAHLMPDETIVLEGRGRVLPSGQPGPSVVTFGASELTLVVGGETRVAGYRDLATIAVQQGAALIVLGIGSRGGTAAARPIRAGPGPARSRVAGPPASAASRGCPGRRARRPDRPRRVRGRRATRRGPARLSPVGRGRRAARRAGPVDPRATGEHHRSCRSTRARGWSTGRPVGEAARPARRSGCRASGLPPGSTATGSARFATRRSQTPAASSAR